MKIIFAMILMVALSAFTVDVTLPDAAQEARAQNLFHQLKCVVCQGQPLNESDATLAQDMRKLIRDKIAEGKSDAEIVAYLGARYGENIATTPPLKTDTLLLWFSPFLLLAAGVGYALWRSTCERLAANRRRSH